MITGTHTGPPGKMGGFLLRDSGGLAWLQAPLLERCPGVVHGFSTRLGGGSRGALASLNLAFHTGDDPDIVLANRRRFFAQWGLSHHDVVSGIQVHSTGMAAVSGPERGRGAFPRTSLAEADGLATADAGVILTAYAADCYLIFLVVPRLPVVAIAHAGWRGTAGGMAGRAVRFLEERWGARPGEILAAVSPGICGQCYRVGEEVARAFAGKGWPGAPFLEPAGKESYFLDLAAANQAQLLAAGLPRVHIAGDGWCTSCRSDLFYSYRREAGTTGRMLGFITITPPGPGRGS